MLLGDWRIYAPQNWVEYNNPKYVEFLLKQPCCITGVSPVYVLFWAFTNDGNPATDLLTLPIDMSLSKEFSTLGPVEFFKKHQINPMWTSLHYIQHLSLIHI